FVFELFEAEGAFHRLERFLGGEGIFGADGVVAGGFLGSGPARGVLDRAGRGEPVPLPLLACRIGPCPGVRPLDTSGFDIGEWDRTWSAEAYMAAVETVRAAIARGDVYQVNLVQHLSAEFDGDPHALAAALEPLRPLHPHPFVTDDYAIVSASPEL